MSDENAIYILNAREKLAAILAPAPEEPTEVYTVHDNPVDAIVAPCMLINWRAPMLDNWAVCRADGHLTVTLIGGRVEVASGFASIESMYDALQRKVRAARPTKFVVDTDQGIGATTIGGVQYLACRVEVRVSLELG